MQPLQLMPIVCHFTHRTISKDLLESTLMRTVKEEAGAIRTRGQCTQDSPGKLSCATWSSGVFLGDVEFYLAFRNRQQATTVTRDNTRTGNLPRSFMVSKILSVPESSGSISTTGGFNAAASACMQALVSRHHCSVQAPVAGPVCIVLTSAPNTVCTTFAAVCTNVQCAFCTCTMHAVLLSPSMSNAHDAALNVCTQSQSWLTTRIIKRTAFAKKFSAVLSSTPQVAAVS